ncbi:MAG: SEC-C metal-binding domain-containing protein, partial [Acidobacteriota bacterium]
MSAQASARPGRNEPCHCGSGRKYKHCCLDKDHAEAAAARAKAAAEAAAQ